MLFRMFASSSISTKNVLCPLARSSKAPTRVKYPVENPDAGVPGRDKTSCLCHDAAQRHCPHVRGLPCHVCPGDDHDLGLRCLQVPCRLAQTPESRLVSTTGCRPSRIIIASAVQLRADIIMGLCDLGKRGRDIENSNAEAICCSAGIAVRSVVEQPGIEVTFQCEHPFIRVRDKSFFLPQFGEGIPFPVAVVCRRS